MSEATALRQKAAKVFRDADAKWLDDLAADLVTSRRNFRDPIADHTRLRAIANGLRAASPVVSATPDAECGHAED